MFADIKNPETGEQFRVEIDDSQFAQLKLLEQEQLTEKKLEDYFDNLNISADSKALLVRLAKVTMKVGKTTYKLGKKIIEIAIYLFSEFPHMSFGLIIGSLLTALISSIPIIGAALGGIATLIVVALGVQGLIKDIGERSYAAKLDEAKTVFAPLGGNLS